MKRSVLAVQQGTSEWHTARAAHYTASEAPAMLGVSKYQSRSSLLAMKATGVIDDVDQAKQRLFDQGHAAESSIRPHIESMIGQELYPATMSADVDGLPLLASLDGITMDETIVMEHKLWNADLAAAVQDGSIHQIEHYTAQMEQQLLVSGADEVIFIASDGTPANMVHCRYRSNPELRQRIIAGWKQFASDLANYQHAPTTPASTGSSPETLPALRIEVTGAVTASNLEEFKSTALAVIGSINKDLQTDQDFADAEQTVKWCRDVEDRLVAAKQHALSQTASIDELFRAVDDISAEARRTRLDLEKLVKARKESLREEIRMGAVNSLRSHYDKINATFAGRIVLGAPAAFGADVGCAMKGKKTLASLREAADNALVTAKIAASQTADVVRINLAVLDELGNQFLFPDMQAICTKQPDDFEARARLRIAEHRAAEERKETERREQIRREEEEKARMGAEKPAPLAKCDGNHALIIPCADPNCWHHPGSENKEQQSMQTGGTMKLGEICAALEFNVNADFIASLGFPHVCQEKNAKLYRRADFPAICRAISAHVLRVCSAETRKLAA